PRARGDGRGRHGDRHPQRRERGSGGGVPGGQAALHGHRARRGARAGDARRRRGEDPGCHPRGGPRRARVRARGHRGDGDGVTAFLQSVAAFAVALGVLITFHEFRHFWVARRCGGKILRFSVGFGKPLFQRRFGPDGTEFVIAALPLGGYVKMLDAREGEVAPEEAHRAFNRRPLGQRALIVAAGPVFNFLFAIAAYWLVYMVGV